MHAIVPGRICEQLLMCVMSHIGRKVILGTAAWEFGEHTALRWAEDDMRPNCGAYLGLVPHFMADKGTKSGKSSHQGGPSADTSSSSSSCKAMSSSVMTESSSFASLLPGGVLPAEAEEDVLFTVSPCRSSPQHSLLRGSVRPHRPSSYC